MELRAQGATEYLVLLAVVLIVALVSVALLGFFPGMASDSQRVQSETYWRSASPVAITEWAAVYYVPWGNIFPYFRVKNTGAYPIRITGIIGADGAKITTFGTYSTACGAVYGNWPNIADYYYLGPGEEKYFAHVASFGLSSCDRTITSNTAPSGGTVSGATSICENSVSSPGTLALPSMGFEYIEYIDNQQITKRQIGKQVIIKCGAPSSSP